MKQLSDLVAEISELILQVREHPEHQSLIREGYKRRSTVADAYQAIAEISYSLHLKRIK